MGALVGTGADEVWVDDTGGTGVPLVLLHPGVTDSRVWDRLVPLLGDRRVVRFDRLGYGRSPRATTAQRPVDQLVGVLDALGLDRVHLVGNSHGGGTSLALAVSQPERVASMTLLCTAIPGFPWPEDAGDPEVDAEYERLVAAKDVEGLSDLYLRIFAAQGHDDYLVGQFRETTELELSGEDLTESNPEVWDSVADIAAPAAVVVGDHDSPETILADLSLADALPGAELVRLDVDHFPQYRAPEAVAQVVLRTVARAGD